MGLYARVITRKLLYPREVNRITLITVTPVKPIGGV